MEQKIKLKTKQLEVLTQIQTKKTQLNSMFQDLNTQEGVILELIIEDAGITKKVTSAKLEEGGVLVLALESNVTETAGEVKKRKKTV